MRHLGTFIAAIVIAPAAWLLIAFGQTQSGSAFGKAASSGAWPAGDFVSPLLLLAGAGILLGLIGTLRFSPLGATLTGLFYIASYVAVMIAGNDAYKLINYKIRILKREAALDSPVISGTTLLLGALLLVSVISTSRWRRWPSPALATAGTDDPTATSAAEETRDFWTPSSPSTTATLTPLPNETSSTGTVPNQFGTPNQFGSPWRTPPGENATEEHSR
jgi:hypothetical protein